MKNKKTTFLCLLALTICSIILYYGQFKGHERSLERTIDPKSSPSYPENDSVSLIETTTVNSRVVPTTRAATSHIVDVISTSRVTGNSSTVVTPQHNVLHDPQSSLNVVHHLSNVVINRGPGRSVHHIYSAYYDSRRLPNRPAIILFGYVQKRSHDSIYCKFIYEDNSTRCMGNIIHTPLIASNVWPESYFCKMSSHDKVPTHVVLGDSGSCESSRWSSPIPVWNRESTVRDTIGVCVQGCMRTNVALTHEIMFDMMVEFLAMVKVLGGKIVTIYNEDIKHELVEKILQLYPGFVDMVQWKNLSEILHSHGQRVLLNDCLYRNMKRVRYLVFIDLDEMIFPVSTNSWMDMLHILEKKGKYASYTFSNNFIEEVPSNASIGLSNHSCPYMKLPKYFVRLKRLPWPNFKQHTKMKMIVKPDLVSALCVHNICKPTVGGYSVTYRVPGSVGLMAHYRVPVPWWYVYGKGVEDRTALKYQDQVMQEMGRVCSLLES